MNINGVKEYADDIPFQMHFQILFGIMNETSTYV